VNIDLFLTDHGQCGLLCDLAVPEPVGGVIFDAQVMTLTLEYVHGRTQHLNIPVAGPHLDRLLFSHRIFFAALENGLIVDMAEVPLLYLNDPYGGTFGETSPLLSRPRRSLIAFEQFMKHAVAAQPVHRSNLSDETSAESVLHGLSSATLGYAPKLIRERQMESAPKTAVFVPATPGLSMGAQGTVRKNGGTRQDDGRET
jgi:hypothetical protein